MMGRIISRLTAAVCPFAAVILWFAGNACARAQELSVLPVNVFLPAGQRAATLSVTNSGKNATGIQIRTYDWNQKDGEDQLVPSNVMLASPPMATIAPGATQIVRLILRKSPVDREATYRIVIDQIPPPAEAGVVHVVLRLSIPIFAMPSVRVEARVRYSVDLKDGQLEMVGVNDGSSHEAIRDIALASDDGHKLTAASGSSPYILAGATRRWRLDMQGYTARSGETLQLTAHGYARNVDQSVSVVAKP